MLKQRVITAIVLLLILLPALFYTSPAPFCALALVLISAGAWEWGRLNGCGPKSSLGFGALLAIVGGATWAGGLLSMNLSWVWMVATGCWVVASVGLLRQGVPAWSAIPRWIRLVGGFLMLWCAWLAVAQARVIGINFLLSSLVLVWVADIFAYFSGRAFGGRFTRSKLAPSISPGKSWEGVWGGMAGVMVLAMSWIWIDHNWQVTVPSLYSQLVAQGVWLLGLGALMMAVMSVAGDLIESLIKRSAGVKDSSGLLPGHGGVLDRVDALLPTLPLAMMFHSLLAP
jgi:phosphatidate cytidylyltransferase